MARRVTISTIGADAPLFAPGKKLHGQKAIDRMLKHWQGELDQVLPDKPDLIVVPEACDRFPQHSMQERLQYYKDRGGQVRDFFINVAREHACYIAYSAIREMDGGTWRNATQLIGRDGKIAGTYHKNHVVIEETTQGGILCGKDAPVIETDFGRVACAICFDLNFDELRRKYAKARPDLIVFSSMYHGGLMQRYWAYSCRAHFASAIAGEQSAILAPTGDMLAHTTNYFDFVTHTVNLDCTLAHLDYNWGKLARMKEKYGPKVRVFDPGYLGSVLVTSESNEFTVQDLVAEFELELLDDYFERALAHRHAPGTMEP